MFKDFWKKKKVRWLAVVLVLAMVLSLLPMDINWAEGPEMLGPSATEEITTQDYLAEEFSVDMNSSEESKTESFVMEESGDSGYIEPVVTSKEISMAKASEDMLANGNYDLTSLRFSASYYDENHILQNVDLSTTENITLPDDATVSLGFNFMMFDGNAVNIGQEYIYSIPSAIRIDVDHVLPLTTSDGDSIGTVHIDQANQRLVFVFNDNVVDQTNIPFYVNFAGGLSADVEETAQNTQITFDTAHGHFDYNVTIVDSYNNTEPVPPGDLGMKKSGTKVYVEGKPYILWDLELNLNGRDSLDAVITDTLPAGLSYVSAGGYPKLTDTKDDSATLSVSETGGVVTINVSNVTTYYRAHVQFLTSYNNDVFAGSEITADTSVTVANTASITEDGSSTPVIGNGNATVSPSVLSKTGSQSGGVITWTVTINKDGLDVGGATYSDLFGTGYSWNTASGSYDPSCITVSPAGAGAISANDAGFEFVVNEANKNDVITLTYQTKIDDYTQTTYANQATLTEPGIYNVSTNASVDGFDLISKDSVSYNEVSKRLKWTITVNAEKADSVFDGATEVVIKDVFNPNYYQNKMKLVSMEITGAEGASSLSDFASCTADANGNITVPASKLKGTALTISVVTEILPEVNDNYVPASWETPVPWGDGAYVNAKNEVILEWNGNQSTDDATRGFVYRTPDLLSKSGEPTKYNDSSLKRDGIIDWTIVSSAYQDGMSIDNITLTDTVPAGMTYVPGSFYICDRYASYNESARTYIEPAFNETTRVLTVSLDRTDSAIASRLDNANHFEIHYQTRVNDRDNVGTSVSYTNNAEFSVDYDGGTTVVDDDSATVTGDLGGVLRKEALYQSGNDYVDWEVSINEGRFDMSDVNNPVIRDQLASYLQYTPNSGHLYRVDLAGNRTEVTAGFVVNVIDDELVVSLPNIGSDCFVFTFRTRFTVSQAQAATLDFKNDIAFQGEGLSSSTSSNNVRNISFSSSSAGAYHENELRLQKLDPNGNGLAGAVFQVLDSMGTVIATGTTDANGSVVFKGVKSFAEGYSYELIETTAPNGYQLDDTPIPVKITSWQTASDGTRYYELEIENEPINNGTEFTVQKLDDSNSFLPGAEFSVFSHVSMTPTTIINKVVTDDNGKATFSVPYSSSHTTIYYVKETKTPNGYKHPAADTYYQVVIGIDGSVESVTKQPSGTAVTVTGSAFSVVNEAVVGSLTIKKVDEDSNGVLPGATFTLYSDSACTDDVATVTTGVDGLAVFSDLEVGHTYYYKETVAPRGYVLDDTVYSVEITDNALVEADGSIHQDVSVSVTATNEQEKGSIVVTKTDDSTPAKLLKDAEFTLFAASDLSVPFNKPGTTNPYVVVTGEDGVAKFENLPFGEYVVKETNVPTGYQVSAMGSNVNVTVNSQTPERISVVNEIIRFSLRIEKTDDSTPANPLAGAFFVVRNSANDIVASGETDTDGTITFDDLPYDNYTVTETRGVAGYVIDSTPQNVNVADIIAGGTVLRTFVNHKENGSIRFKKVDKDTNDVLAGAVFTLYNSSGERVKTASSDASGDVVFTNLPYGSYTIKETKAPVQYQLNADVWSVTVENDTPVVVLVSTVDNSTTGSVSNEKIPSGMNYMHFKLLKADGEGNPLEGAQFQLIKNFPNDGGTYGTNNTNGAPAVCTTYSDENGVVEFIDIYIEHDPEGTTYTLKEVKAPFGYTISQEIIFDSYTKEQMVGNIGSSGLVLGTELPFADTPGAVVPDITTSADIDAENLVVNSSDSYLMNKKLLGNILITKKASGAVNTFLANAEFTLYKLNPTTNAYELFVQSGLVNPAKTDANGVVTFKKLPLGKYRVVETNAPAGYILDAANSRDFEITATNYNNVSELSATFSDAPISVTVNKYAIGGSVQLPGAVLGLYKANDTSYTNCLEQWTTTNTAHKIGVGKLVAGSEYMIHEISAPTGYTVIPENVKFKVNANGTVTYTGASGSPYGSANGTSVTIRDKANTLWISKVGIQVGGASGTTPLSGASISIIDDESGAVVHTFTSTTNAYAVPSVVLEGPTAGNDYHYYTIHENSAPGGYALAEDIKIAMDALGNVYQTDDEGNKIDTLWAGNTVIMEDEPYENFYFAKRDKVTNAVLSGAEFAIYEASVWEANPNTSNINYAADVVTGDPLRWTTTTSAKNVSLDIGTYYYVELKAPKGYAVGGPIKFQICDGTPKYIKVLEDSDNSNLSANKLTLTCLDQSIVVKFIKWSDNMQPLRGGSFSLHESNSNKQIGTKLGNSFAATGSAITFDNSLFEINHYYAIVEDEAPYGYEKCNPVFFYIDQSGKLKDLDDSYIDQNLVILVDGEKQLGFQKVDGDTGLPLSGVKMSISSDEDADFETITWITDGNVKYLPLQSFVKNKTYILTETKTIAGYTYAASKSFKYVPGTGGAEDKLYVDGALVNTMTIVMENQPISIWIDKLIAGTNTDLSGAKLQITDENGNVVDTWITDGSSHELDTSTILVSKTAGEHVYTLTEISAPEFYACAQPIEFYIDKDGQIKLLDNTVVSNNHLKMYDAYIGVLISKQDIDGNELAGASLMISSSQDTGFNPITWTSTTTPYNLDLSLFAPNVTYILSEVAAPNGYACANAIEFYFDVNGNLYVDGTLSQDNSIVMVDRNLLLKLAKKDEDTNRYLANATFGIFDEETNNELLRFRSGSNITEINTERLQTSTSQNPIIYIMRELSAPTGYELAEDVSFYFDENGKLYVMYDGEADYQLADDNLITIYDKPSETSETTETTETSETTEVTTEVSTELTTETTTTQASTETITTTSRQTGDMSPIKTVALLFIISVMGCTVIFITRRKKQD